MQRKNVCVISSQLINLFPFDLSCHHRNPRTQALQSYAFASVPWCFFLLSFLSIEWVVIYGGVEGKVSYASLSNLEKENSKFTYVDDFDDTAWTGMTPGGSVHPPPRNGPPEVNLKNVMSGIFAILTGRNKDHPGLSSLPQLPSSNVSFLGSAKNGETFLHSSVYIPSAPRFLSQMHLIIMLTKRCWKLNHQNGFQTVQQQLACSAMLLYSFDSRKTPLPLLWRHLLLDPLQGVLINTISNAVQVAKHDVMDWTCSRGWLNLPVARLNPEKSIPAAVLKGARGLAILTVAKAGVLVSYKVGTGLVVARRSDGSWSAPSAILSFGLGWGAQVGGELMDFIIVLHDANAVKTFCSRMHFSLGAGCSAAAGPIGRVVEADLRAGEKGSGMCYTYSCSKGAFVGVSLEGNVVATRMDTNLRFYGDPYLTTADILLGTVDRPKAAEPLYVALRDLYSKLLY
ncbi:hypothetical protein DH2020_018466 [Rehmannia glutinosa]|uniref:Ysc84 actin-binding domain-containing protein n=1 Tax=Rehmannia glutinosa TaxID=99300 RepID=A0ABR0WMH1_REHGL